MHRDPLVEEVRAIREAYAARFDYDLEALARDLKELERHSGRQVVSPPQPRAAHKEHVITRREDASG